MEEILIEWNYATDEPRGTDYSVDYLIEIKWEVWNWVEWKRPKDKITIQNQSGTPACTIYSAWHIVNGLNILEDELYGKFRTQIDNAKLWIRFCSDRGNYQWGSSIQTVANWMKKNKYISWYVTIKNGTPQDIMVKQMRQAIDMGNFISSGSAFGAWGKIKKTGIYEDSNPQYFLWHAFCIVWYEDDFFWAMNSYWPKRWPFGWYFKIPNNMVTKLYSKLVFIDFNDKDVFAKLQEVEKIKQAVALFREVYPIADKPVQQYLETIKLWENFSKLYNTTI
jgi:hypothetical protein